MIRNGSVGGSPEVYEKINPVTGKGAVIVFSSRAGKYNYISEKLPDKAFSATRGTEVNFDKDGHAVLSLSFEKTEAKIILFGVNHE